jgi:hypothetical protein
MEPFSIENGLLNPSYKVHRMNVYKEYEAGRREEEEEDRLERGTEGRGGRKAKEDKENRCEGEGSWFQGTRKKLRTFI